jgi:hypothetical protein
LRCLIFICVGIISLSYHNDLHAQLPTCDIYAFKVSNILGDQCTVRKVLFLNAFNLNGYNNQVFPIDENRILCSSKKPSETDTEIYLLNIEKEELSLLTTTDDSEFSPRVYPNDSKFFTCVRVPQSDNTKQLLSLYNFENGILEKDLLGKQGKIGYYRHLSDGTWACFIVEEPSLFAICEEKEASRKVFASGIGRCFEFYKQDEILFVHKLTEEAWVLKSYSIKEEKSMRIIEMPKGVEDFCILDNGAILCAQDNLILRFIPGINSWQKLIDLKAYGILKATRLATKGNTLFVVNMKD